ncbi:MAG: tail fiber protein [Leptospiraceae bacterium]|nr:tail fiber protein [Leptospiraceae bacterium]MBK9503444.1 tail fiber protein [Leptospiraceae bacterium]MBL0266602.1 tail fiber protein [Leptospiraceae bacterium]MBP6738344.1 tail fiber protein [Leptospiraceae bacterium]
MPNTILDKLGTRISLEIKAIKNQLLNISSGSIPSGMVLPFTGLVAPTGFLLCHGQEVNRTVYANLFAILGTSHGQGDNLSTFNLPDYRGVFLRGIDLGKGTDPEASSRQASATGGNTGDNIGSKQEDALQTFTIRSLLPQAYGNQVNFVLAPGFGLSTTFYAPENARVSPFETRPKNISVNYVIKF